MRCDALNWLGEFVGVMIDPAEAAANLAAVAALSALLELRSIRGGSDLLGGF